jgi:choline transport protein
LRSPSSDISFPSTIAFGLGNGGTAGLIYLYIIVVVFFTLVNISMAEMASMAPTAGGQYHWISEFAPRSKQKFLSFIVGWLCTLGWQSGVSIGCFLAATEIQGLIVLNNDDYVYERWHGTLLTIAIVLFVAFFNTFLAKHLPLVEGMVLCLHLGGFICILVPLWVLGPRGNSHEIWTTFTDGGGWGSSMFCGLLLPELRVNLFSQLVSQLLSVSSLRPLPSWVPMPLLTCLRS